MSTLTGIGVQLHAGIGDHFHRNAHLRAEVAAWQAQRDRLKAKVNWQFTTHDARVRLKRLYPTFDE